MSAVGSAGTVRLDGVEGYAAAVRAHLADLGREQVEDLTDDLEADLADALADERHAGHGTSLVEQFGTPEAYAAELRAAAGLDPVPVAPPRPRLRDRLAAPWRALVAVAGRLLGELRGLSWWAPVEGFLVALRPLWWVARGWALFELVGRATGLHGTQIVWVPRDLGTWVLFLLCVVPSVQFGRRRWLQGRWQRRAAMWANLVAAVAVLPMTGWLQGQSLDSRSPYVDQPVYASAPQDGVWVDGTQVSNLFVYDADGERVEAAQVYDDRGRPVRTTDDDGFGEWWFPDSDEPWSFVPRADTDGRQRWNVYPLTGAPSTQFEIDEDGHPRLPVGQEPSTPPWPFAKAPALAPVADPADSEAPGAEAPAGEAPGDGASAGPGPDGTAPDGTAPDGTAPDGTAPDGTAPDGTGPDGAADGTVGDGAADGAAGGEPVEGAAPEGAPAGGAASDGTTGGQPADGAGPGAGQPDAAAPDAAAPADDPEAPSQVSGS